MVLTLTVLTLALHIYSIDTSMEHIYFAIINLFLRFSYSQGLSSYHKVQLAVSSSKDRTELLADFFVREKTVDRNSMS